MAEDEKKHMCGQSFNLDLSETFQALPNAPIIEAVIHWQARPNSFDDPKQILFELKERLPDYPHERQQQEITFHASVGKEVLAQHQQEWHGIRLESEDRLHVAQFKRNGFVFSRLKPYNDWDSFETEAKRLWQIYYELTNPTVISRLGVRFINQISIPDINALDDLLYQPPKSPFQSEWPFKSFVHQDEFDIPSHPFKLNVIQAIQPPNPPATTDKSFILDLDVFTTSEVEQNQLDDKLNHMHWIKNKAFFSFMSAESIERFKEQ